jgi:ribosomal protein L32
MTAKRRRRLVSATEAPVLMRCSFCGKSKDEVEKLIA